MIPNRSKPFPFSKAPADSSLRGERTELENVVKFLQDSIERLRLDVQTELSSNSGGNSDALDQLNARIVQLEARLNNLAESIQNLDFQEKDPDLDSLSALDSLGLVARVGSGVYITRDIQVPSDLLGITNPGGVPANPTLTLPARAANTFFGGPTTGADASPTFRKFYVATQIVYVAKWGVDNAQNDGLGPERPKLTIGAAITAASALTPSASNRIAVQILDAGTYVEDLTCVSYVDIQGQAATLDGVVTLVDNMTLRLWAVVPSSGNNRQLLRKTAGNTSSFAFVDIIDSRNVTSSRCVYNIAASSVLFVWCAQMFVGAGNIGIGDSTAQTGHVHFKVPDLYLAGNSAIGIDATDTSTTIIGYVDHILEIGSPTGTTAIVVGATGSVRLMACQIAADTAYTVTSGGTLHIVCSDITGTRTGTATVTGDALATILQTLGALANAAGVLRNDGAGVLDWASFLSAEQGAFTPTFTFLTAGDLSVSYSLQSGFYLKVGRCVHFSILMTFTPTYTTSTGVALIQGLPAPVSLSIVSYGVFQVAEAVTWPAGRTQVLWRNDGASTNSLILQASGSGQTTSSFGTTQFPSGASRSIRLSGHFFTD